MKKSFYAILCSFIFLLVGCTASEISQTLAGVASLTNNGGVKTNSLTNADVIKGLKEALAKGITASTTNLSRTNGFLNNSLIKIPFPEEAIKVKNTLENLGMKGPVNKFVATLNHAAEEATKEALPIFISAIREMSITDGFAILKGGENAATDYLQQKTASQLVTAFKPKVNQVTQKVELTKHWNPLIKKYNKVQLFTGGKKVNPDLDAYVTQKAINGLFTSIAVEEAKIRKDPVARTTEILRRVFGR